MVMSPFFVITACGVSLVFTALVGVGLVTFVRRTWQLVRSGEDQSTQAQILDGLDQVQTRLYSMSERLGRLEQRLEAADSTRERIASRPEA